MCNVAFVNRSTHHAFMSNVNVPLWFLLHVRTCVPVMYIPDEVRIFLFSLNRTPLTFILMRQYYASSSLTCTKEKNFLYQTLPTCLWTFLSYILVINNKCIHERKLVCVFLINYTHSATVPADQVFKNLSSNHFLTAQHPHMYMLKCSHPTVHK